MPTTQIGIQTTYNATGSAAADVALGKVGTAASKAERDLLAYANTVAKAQRTQGDAAGAVRTYEAALQQVDRTSKQAIATEGQLAASIAQVQRQAQSAPILPRTLESFGTQAIDQFKSGLLSIVGPAALVTGGIAALTSTVQSFEEAFKFKAELDQNTASITAQLKGVRDSGQVFAEAGAFAEKYKLTQEETTTAVQASVPLLRQSKASLTDVLTVLSQLQVLKPEQGLQGAAFALAELEGGQSRSLATRFNIPIAKATEMKNEIQKGGDAVQILGKYLDDAGIGADALAVRTKGAAGALNDSAVAAEKLKIAQAEFGQGPGTAIIREQTVLLTGLTRLLNGDLATGIAATVTNWKAGTAAQLAYGAALNSGKTEVEAHAAAQAAFNASLQKSAATYSPTGQAAQVYAAAIKHGATAAEAQVAAERLVPPALVNSAGAFNAAAAAALYYADAKQHVAAATDGGAFNAYVQAVNASGIANQEAATKIQFFEQAAQISARASIVDSAAKDAQQAKTALVNAETDKAAKAFLALNPTMDASQAFAAAVAQGLGVVTAQVIAFRIEMNKAKSDLAGLATTDPNAQLKAGLAAYRSGSALTANDISEGNVRYLNQQETARQQAAKDAAALLGSEIELARAKKDTGKEIDLLRQKQSQYAKGTAEYNNIQAQIIGIQTAGGRGRVSAAQSTALQLQNVEENTQAELLKTQREGLERLRDQEEDYTLRRVRSKEDEDEKIRGLLARGERAAAARERADFEKKQRRDQEDFNIARQRTIRNNAESAGDITGGAARRTDQIDARAALRGVRPVAAGSANAPILSTPAASAGASSSAPTVIQVNVTGTTNLDGQKVGDLIFDVIHQRLDADLALEMRSATPPGAGQSAVAGARP